MLRATFSRYCWLRTEGALEHEIRTFGEISVHCSIRFKAASRMLIRAANTKHTILGQPPTDSHPDMRVLLGKKCTSCNSSSRKTDPNYTVIQIDGVAPFVADSSRLKFTTRQNLPIFNSHYYIALHLESGKVFWSSRKFALYNSFE